MLFSVQSPEISRLRDIYQTLGAGDSSGPQHLTKDEKCFLINYRCHIKSNQSLLGIGANGSICSGNFLTVCQIYPLSNQRKNLLAKKKTSIFPKNCLKFVKICQNLPKNCPKKCAKQSVKNFFWQSVKNPLRTFFETVRPKIRPSKKSVCPSFNKSVRHEKGQFVGS